MNRKLSIPIMNGTLQRYNRNLVLKELKELSPDYVFIAINQLLYDSVEREKEFNLLRDNIKFFKNNGFEVGVWCWTFWVKGKNSFEKITGIYGSQDNFVCPSDEDFLNFISLYVKELVLMEPDIILFDDDYRYNYLGGGVSCFCKNHIKYVSQKLNEEITKDYLVEQVLKGTPNKYRKAWQESKAESMEKYAKVVRDTVDSINPDIRVGLCSCLSTWVGDGTNPIKLAKILAGNTKPLLRFIGAPYWAVNRSFGGNRLQDIIELERMQAGWCEDAGVETLNEGDSYPRPRYICPAVYLELFDTAMIADGNTDGIHKYMFDYISSSEYEKGYVSYHKEFSDIRNEIYKLFDGRKDVGVRIFESMDKFDNAEFSSTTIDNNYEENMFTTLSTTILSASTIPSRYNKEKGITLVFGENIKDFPYTEDNSPLILDGYSANYLKSQGIDVGLKNVDFEVNSEGVELYSEVDTEFSRVDSIKRVEFDCDVKCKPILWYSIDDIKTVAAYVYKNGQDQSFLVFAFDSRFTSKDGVRNYLIQKALVNGIEQIDKKLPAVCLNNPDLYILIKRKEDKMSVGLWNFSADKVMNRKIVLGNQIESIKFVNTSGTFNKNIVQLDAILPFSVVAFEVVSKDL